MKKTTVFFVIVLLTLVHGLALGNNVLYDDFSGESLDAEKWSDYSNNENPVIVNGALELAISGSNTKLTNSLNFLQNRGIISIQTKVKIANESYVSSGASGKFRIEAMCYNDSHGPGSGQSHNQNEGNVWAEFRLALDDSHTLKAIAEILRIDDAEDTSETTLFYQEFNTSIDFDTEYTMSMGVENGVFVLTLDSETYSYPIKTPMYIPYNGEQALTSRLYLDQGEQGLFKAVLDDVMVTYDESDNTFLVGSIINSRWGTGSDYNTWADIEVYNADESFKENVESITVTAPSGEKLPYNKDDFEFVDYGSSFDYGIYDIPGQPEIGTYTFTIVANGKTYTTTDTQDQNRELPVPDINSFSVDGQTFSWDLVDYEECIPLYYRFRLYDAYGNRLASTDRIQDMDSFTYEDGQLTMGETYLMYVRVSDSGDWYQEQNNAYSIKYFTFEASRSISGTVLGDDDNDPETPDVPVAGMHIQVFSDACNWVQIGWGNTDTNGNYTVSGLPVGTDVYVKTCTECNNMDINYINEYYDTNSINCSEATPITITEENTSNINFDLAPGGTISGRLLDLDGNPIQNIEVNLNDAQCGGQWVASIATDDQGYFEIKGVPDIPVYLYTWNNPENNTNWVNTFWNGTATGSYDCMDAVPINANPLYSVLNINMSVEAGGSVSGRILDTDGNPIPNFHVNAEKKPCGGAWVAGTLTDESGNFVINNIPVGEIYICTADSEDGSQFVNKVWDGNNGSADCNEGLAIDVIANQDYPGINMSLETGGSIFGTVLGDDDNDPATPSVPVSGMHVQIFSDACNWIQIDGVNTDINGNYVFNGLPVGTDIYVKTCTECNNISISYINEYYNTNSINCSEATPITVIEGETTDINFDLVPGGSISGRLLDPDGNPIKNIEVNLNDAQCGGQWVASIATDDQGYFEIKGVPDIPVYLSTWNNPENNTNWMDSFWNGTANSSTDCMDSVPIHVSPLESVLNIDMSLEAGGSISGTVLGDDDNNPHTPNVPVEGMHIQVVSDACNWVQIGWGNTDINGKYIVSGLPVGTDVYVKTCTECNNTSINYIDEYYNTNSINCDQATPIRITDGDTPDINFDLVPGGTISGRLLDPDGNPIPNFHVNAEKDPCGGAWVAGTMTDESGIFVINGIPVGDIYIRTEGSENGSQFVNRVWDGNNGSADCNEGLAIDVIANQDYPEINMILYPDASGYWLFDVTLYSTENLDNPDWNEETTWQSRMQGRKQIKQDNSTFSIFNWFYGNVYDYSTYQHYEVIRNATGSTELTLVENDPTLGWIYEDFHTIWFDIGINSKELQGEVILTFWKILNGSTQGNILKDEDNPTYAKFIFTGKRFETVVMSSSSNFTVTSDNSPVLIYGTSQENHITLESGVYAELMNFPGANTITIQSDSDLFTVYRSGACVVLEGTYGTVLKMPATLSVQTVVFNDRSLDLVITNNHVMLGSIEVGTSPVPVF